MSQYSWPTCPTPIREQVLHLLQAFQAILDDNIVAIYLHGSLAMGCFNPLSSDIDLLVVTRQQMPVKTKRGIIELLLSASLAPQPIEISFVVEGDIDPFRHRLPYDLHYSESWRERFLHALEDNTWHTWNDETKYDSDLAAHLTIARTRGLCLAGRPASDVLPDVSPIYYIASILGDFDDAYQERQAMPVYFVLNACRVLAYLREGHIFSKDEGGEWGLDALSSEFHNVIEWALERYRGNDDDAREGGINENALERFAGYMQQQVQALR